MELNEIDQTHEHATASMKVMLLVFVVILIGVLGYMVWQQNITPDTTDYSATKVTTKEDTSDCDEAAAGQKNYSSAAQGFCFNYPSGWTLTDEADVANKIAWRVSLTDKVVPNSDYPGQIHFYKYKTLQDLDSQNLSATSIKDYLDKYAALDDPLYVSVETATVAGKSGYMAKAGIGQISGGTFYFVTLDDNSVMQVWVVSDNANTASVLASLTFSD